MENIVWKSIKEELPPIGKKILITTPVGGLSIMTLCYTWNHEEDLGRGYPLGGTESMIQAAGGYWMLIPERPEHIK